VFGRDHGLRRDRVGFTEHCLITLCLESTSSLLQSGDVVGFGGVVMSGRSPAGVWANVAHGKHLKFRDIHAQSQWRARAFRVLMVRRYS
jgi:hypothetical protein